MDDEQSLRAVAALFGVKVSRLRKAAQEGRLAARYTGHQYLVRPSEVERFLREGGREPQTTHAGTHKGEPGMTRVIAVAIPKGGTGKTTTTMNLGAALAEHGQRVLLVDLDPQASLTYAFGYEPNDLEHTVYSAIKHYLSSFEPHLEQAILPTPEGLDLVPTNALLELANDELPAAPRREFVVQELLAPLMGWYDIILIDTRPSLGPLVQNALVAASEVLIPLQAQYLSTKSVPLILNEIQLMRRSKLNPELEISGVLVTMVDERTIINREATAYIRKDFGRQVRVFNTIVKHTVRFQEAQACHQSMLRYDPESHGAMAYRALAKEVLNGAAA